MIMITHICYVFSQINDHTYNINDDRYICITILCPSKSSYIIIHHICFYKNNIKYSNQISITHDISKDYIILFPV